MTWDAHYDSTLRDALNREATMRETLARTQGECTRLVEELREARRAAVTPMFTSEDTETLERAVLMWGPNGPRALAFGFWGTSHDPAPLLPTHRTRRRRNSPRASRHA